MPATGSAPVVSVSAQQTSHELLREVLRGFVLAAIESGPCSGGETTGSVQWRACAVLYQLLSNHPLDRRGRCRSCRRPGELPRTTPSALPGAHGRALLPEPSRGRFPALLPGRRVRPGRSSATHCARSVEGRAMSPVTEWLALQRVLGRATPSGQQQVCVSHARQVRYTELASNGVREAHHGG